MKTVLSTVILLAIVAFSTGFRPIAVSGAESLALGGYDPVMLKKEGKLAKGAAYIYVSWQGAEWRFVTQQNMQDFLESPEDYSPQFGGYCAACIAGLTDRATTAQPGIGDPTSFFVYQGKIYVFQNEGLRKRFRESPEKFIASAEQHWNRWRQEGKIDAANE
ncbi:MAG: YHS domain-containing (seleno)protein [Verrucomicrobiota bacterium]